jgi:hypothetical protein
MIESQEPVAWMVWGENNVPSLTFTKPEDKYVFDDLYITPPAQRTWVGLTDEEQSFIYDQVKQIVNSKPFWVRFADAIEAKLKDKNI